MSANSGDAKTSSGLMRVGWTLSQADIAAAIGAKSLVQGSEGLNFVTGSIENVKIFGTPCFGDMVNIYTEVLNVDEKNPSKVKVAVHVTARSGEDGLWRSSSDAQRLVMSAEFNMVCFDQKTRRPANVPHKSVYGKSGSALPPGFRFYTDAGMRNMAREMG